jgi:hypothetical protein
MRARCLELVEKSVAAMIAAIEIYNKPDFKYREETFSVLSVNSWELLIKAYWLKQNTNRIKSLYVYEKITKKDGTKGKQERIKLTRSGNPFTHSLEYLGTQLLSQGLLNKAAWQNILAVIEIRDNAVHFYNKSYLFSRRLQEVGSASVKNYVSAIKDWFDEDLTEFNFFLMPLSFVAPPSSVDGIVLSKEEANLVKYINSADSTNDPKERYSVAVNINVTFSRSKVKDALQVQLSGDPGATPITLTEEQIRQKYRLTYGELIKECKKRYSDFKLDRKFYACKRDLEADLKYAKMRFLDPGNPRSSKKMFYSEAILLRLDESYCKRKV